jgi:hypothetical protein
MLDCLPALSSARNNNNGQNQIIIGQDISLRSRVIVVQEGLKSIGTPDPTDSSRYSFLWRYDAYFHEYDKAKEKELIDQLSRIIPILAAHKSDDFKDEGWYRDLIEELSRLKLGDIKKVFTNVFEGSQNRYSMLVHSYPVDKHLKNMDCLYTGDIPITESVKNTIISIMPHYIQVPHHGSDYNYGETIYNKNQIAFISAGKKNTYGHPGRETLVGLIQKCKSVHMITEDKESKYKCRFKLK